MKRRNIRKPIVVLALVAAMLFPTAVHATEAQDGGDSGSVILNGGTGGEAGNAEAQEVYQELLDSVSFIATDPTWSNIMNIKGVTQLVYDATIPERDGKIPFEELSDFDRLIYELTYCCFAPLKSANGKSWETAKTSWVTPLMFMMLLHVGSVAIKETLSRSSWSGGICAPYGSQSFCRI